jgi:hypothetical protein
MSAAALLNRLDRPKQTGPDRWLAKCPAHEDRSPSLSVRELDDGRVLINCFAGCGAIDVLDSVGLTWSALFPERLPGRGPAGGFTPSHSLRRLLEGCALCRGAARVHGIRALHCSRVLAALTALECLA